MIRVTDVLDWITEPELLAWYKRVGFKKAEEISHEALWIGTQVDQRIQAELLHQDTVPTQHASVLNCLAAWEQFKQEHLAFVSQVAGIQTEFTDGEIVGHPDLLIAETEGDTCTRWGIVDIKTSKAIQPKYLTQVAAYFHLSKHDLWTPPAFVSILRLDKLTGRYEYTEISGKDIEYEVKVFQAYLTAYQHGQRIREVLRKQLEEEVLDVS